MKQALIKFGATLGAVILGIIGGIALTALLQRISNMKVEVNNSHWRDALHFGPFIEWEDWNIWQREFTIGFSFGPWDFGLKISLWNIEETIEMLKSRGMSADEAWAFCDTVRSKLPDPYDSRVNMRKEIKEELAKC